MHTRPAVEGDIPAIKRIANAYKRELGYVMLPALRESMARGGLHVAVDGERVVGFVNWRKRRDGVTVIYEIATARDSARQGVGRALLATASGTVRLKCTTDNDANEFYARMGFAHVGTEEGRKRALNVWQRCT